MVNTNFTFGMHVFECNVFYCYENSLFILNYYKRQFTLNNQHEQINDVHGLFHFKSLISLNIK